MRPRGSGGGRRRGGDPAAAGHACPVVSAGSTPTAMSRGRFDGLTEFRAGVCVFFDLFQAGVGVCGIDEIALSVLRR